MKITYLGTGASEGIPAMFCKCTACEKARKAGGKERKTRAGVLIDEKLLIDLSPDTYLHNLLLNIDMTKVENALITHTHSDHFYPEELLLRDDCCARHGELRQMQIYANGTAVRRINETLALSPSAFSRTEAHTLQSGRTEQVGEYAVTPFRVEHIVGEDCFVYLIEKGGKTYLHYTDGPYPAESLFAELKSRGVKIDQVTADCTFSCSHDEYYGHMNIWQIEKMKERMEKDGTADKSTKWIASHVSHYSGHTHAELEETASKMGIIVAYDGYETEI